MRVILPTAAFNTLADLMRGLDYAVNNNDYIDQGRLAGLGASFGGFMINWINGHTDRFVCLGNLSLVT